MDLDVQATLSHTYSMTLWGHWKFKLSILLPVKTKLDKRKRVPTGGGPAPPKITEAEDALLALQENNPSYNGLVEVIDSFIVDHSKWLSIEIIIPHLGAISRVFWPWGFNAGLGSIPFLAATKQLYKWFSPSARLSVCLSITPFWLCSHHHIIMKFSGVSTNDRSNVHAKGQGHRSRWQTS